MFTISHCNVLKVPNWTSYSFGPYNPLAHHRTQGLMGYSAELENQLLEVFPSVVYAT